MPRNVFISLTILGKSVPTGFARVTSVVDWIKDKTSDGSFCAKPELNDSKLFNNVRHVRFINPWSIFYCKTYLATKPLCLLELCLGPASSKSIVCNFLYSKAHSVVNKLNITQPIIALWDIMSLMVLPAAKFKKIKILSYSFL